MPNGHLPDAPPIDPKDPHAAHLTWIMAGLSVMYSAIGEVKAELLTFAIWKTAEERRQLREQAAIAVRAELRTARTLWWKGAKVRVEVAAALVAVGILIGGLALSIVQRL